MDIFDIETQIVLTIIAVYALIALVVAWFVSKKKKQAQRTLWRIGPIH